MEKVTQIESPELKRLIDKYLESLDIHRSASPHTQRAYYRDLQQVFSSKSGPKLPPNLNEFTFLQIAREAMKKWSNLALASRNRKAAVVKSFFSWLYANKFINTDIASQLPLPRVPEKVPHFLSLDEALTLLSAIKKSLELNKQDPTILSEQALILLLYGGGLRVSEACNLEWNQVKWDRSSLLIKGKGSVERLVSVPPMVIGCLKKLGKGSKFVFGEAPLKPRKAYEIVRQWGKKAGLLKPLHPHALRHSYATHLLSDGINLRTLQRLLGHSSLRATQKYTHLGIDQLAMTLENCHPLGQSSRNAKRKRPKSK